FGLGGSRSSSGRCRSAGTSAGDCTQQGTDVHRLALLGGDGFENASRRGRNLDSDLVGLELDNGLIGGNGVPHLLEPLADRCVADAFDKGGDADFSRHCLVLYWPRASSRKACN